MTLKVRVLDTHSQQTLFECSLEEGEKAYAAAAEYEAMGLDVVVDHPNVNQSLASELGIKGESLSEFEESLETEMNDHEGSCCFEADNKTIH